jgi:hypothetical protein
MSKRRLRGEGAVFYDRHAKLWVGQVDLGPDDQGRRRRPKVTGRTKSEAARKLQDVRAKASRGIPIGDGKLTVGQWLEHWLVDILPNKASVKSTNTIDNYSWAIHRHLIPALGSKRLRALRPEDVDHMLLTRAQAGMAKNSLVRLRSVRNRALRNAQARGKLDWNAAAVVDVPDAPVSEGRSFTVDEAKRLLKAAAADRLGAAVLNGLHGRAAPRRNPGLPVGRHRHQRRTCADQSDAQAGEGGTPLGRGEDVKVQAGVRPSEPGD